ncbi:MAG TPA: cytochrome c [Rhizobacter sp.]|nr:cytochrome c [Rhizobacter sp.]
MRRYLLLGAALWCVGFAAQAAGEAEREAGRKLFNSGTQPSCAVCHTLRDAGAEGAVGPVLDELQPDEARVANVLRTGLGVMPPFRDKLTEQQIALLARYVAQASAPPR